MDRDLNHDEHQFLAPAALVGREGLQPWRDFPLYHLPNLVYAYAWAERGCGDLVLGAKLVNFAACASIIAALVFLSFRLWPRHGLTVGLCAVLLLLSDPLFRYTAGKTWNHEVPTALLLAAGGLLVWALRRDRIWLSVVCGLLGGLAVGCRLTFAPTLVGLALFPLLFPLPWRRRFLHAGMLTLAATAALGPSLYCLAQDPERFIFGNFQFPRIRLADPENTRIQKTMTIWRKVRYFGKEIVVHSWPVFFLWLAVAARPGWQWLRTRRLGNPEAGLCLFMVPFVLAGCFSPSRYQYQHFFVFIPLLLIATVSGGNFISQYIVNKRLIIVSLLLVCGWLAFRAAPDYPSPGLLKTPEEWFCFKLQRQVREMRSLVPKGPILTLAPTLPLTAKLTIYPEFATGIFGWRSASFVEPARRPRLHLVAPEDLAAFLEEKPPSAVLTGVEDDDEETLLINWAQSHGFQPHPLKKKRTLWVPSAAF